MARKKEFNEEEVLAKALQAFWCKGYEGTSMQDLVEAMGINRFSIYDTFESKEKLYLLALRQYQEQQYRQMTQFYGQTGSVRKAVEALLDKIITDTITDKDKKGCFIVNATTEMAHRSKEVQQIASQTEQHIEYIFAEVIRKGHENGELAAEKSPEELSAFLYSVIQGLKVMAMTHGNQTILNSVKRSALSVFN